MTREINEGEFNVSSAGEKIVENTGEITLLHIAGGEKATRLMKE